MVFDEVLECHPLDLVLQSVEYHAAELVYIHLFAGVDGFALVVFEGMAEVAWIVILLLTFL